MALQDIIVHNSPMGAHGRVQHYPLNASQAFFKGEPVRLNADGELTESLSGNGEVDNANIVGIAGAGPGATGDQWVNPKTGDAYDTGDMVPVIIPGPDVYFKTRNFTSAGSAFDDIAPLQTDVGEEAALELIGGTYGISLTTSTPIVRIVDLLDENMKSIQGTTNTLATGTTYWVVFAILAHQFTPDTGVVVTPAA